MGRPPRRSVPSAKKGCIVESVRISKLRPGQVVGAPVTSGYGAVLCKQGHRLSQKSIQRLRTAGVHSVQVETDDANAVATQQRIARIENRFHGIDDPWLLCLKATVLDLVASNAG